ncbi:hypothetical protein LPJ70_002254, partial [Coemansia sp. RSA 2708]
TTGAFDNTVCPTSTLLEYSAGDDVQTYAAGAETMARPLDPALSGARSDAFWYGGAVDTQHDTEIAATANIAARIDFDAGVRSALPGKLKDIWLHAADERSLYMGADDQNSSGGLSEDDGAADAITGRFGGVDTNFDDALAGCELNLIRAPDDMYTPRWIRGIGRDKEGLCPVCFGSGTLNWRRMKCSAYWYHLNYFHGVSSLTGRPFPKPQETRTVAGRTGRERQQGLCGVCGQWVYTDSSRRISINVPEIYWWKHIQGCIKRVWQEKGAGV